MPGAHVGLVEALGCVLLDDLQSPLDLPPFDNAAMDGYAVMARDLVELPAKLPVTADIPAGPTLPARLSAGTTQRIMTGAPVPTGADTVVRVEWTDAGNPVVTIHRMPDVGSNIRRVGEETRRGDLVLPAGSVLTPARLAALASMGYPSALVHRRPRVTVLATGSELVTPGQPRPAGSIYESNATMLAALVTADGGELSSVSHVPDQPDRLIEMLRAATESSDLLLTAGGVSAGAYEVVKQALTPLGTVRFLNVAMSPGSPQGLGHVVDTPVLTLPGNPVAAFVSYLLFVRPLLRRLQGHSDLSPGWSTAQLSEPVTARTERTCFVPGGYDPTTGIATVRPRKSSHMLNGLADADCLLRIEPKNSGAMRERVVSMLML